MRQFVNYILLIPYVCYALQPGLYFFREDTKPYGLTGVPLVSTIACVLFLMASNFSWKDLRSIVPVIFAASMLIFCGFIELIFRGTDEYFIFIVLINLILGYLAAFVFSRADRCSILKKIISIFSFVFILTSVYYLYCSFLYSDRNFTSVSRLFYAESIINSNTVSYVCVAMIIFIDAVRLELGANWIRKAVWLVALVLVALLESRGAQISVFLYVVFEYRTRAAYLLLLIFVLFSVSVFLLDKMQIVDIDKYLDRYSYVSSDYFRTSNREERADYMIYSMERFFENPVFGTEEYLVADHNQWTKMLAAYGVVGFMSFLILLFTIFYGIDATFSVVFIFMFILCFAPLGPWSSVLMLAAAIKGRYRLRSIVVEEQIA